MGFRISPKTILNFSIVLFIVSAGFLLLPKPAQAAITFNAETGISGLWRYDNGTGTFTSLGAGATNFDYFTDDCEAGDYLMIASSSINHARNIKLNVGTAFAASSVEFIWEYEETLGVWKPFNNVVDNTNNLSVLGENWVFYDMPERWDAFSKSGIGYYTFLRLRIVSVTAPTEGGRQGATTVKRGGNTLLISGEGTLASPITWDTVYQADLAGGGSANPAGAWGVVTKEGIGHYQATRIGVTISSNSYMKSEKEVFEWYGNTVKWWEIFSCAGYYRMGIKAGDGSIHSGGRLITAGGYRVFFSGPTYIYDSTIYQREYSANIGFSGNPTEFKRVNAEFTGFSIGGSNWSVDDFYYYNGFGFMIGSQPTLFKGYKSRAVIWPIYFYMDAAPNIEVKDADVQKILYYRRNVDSYMINHIVPLDNITLTFLGVAGTTYTGRLFDTYTFDLKVIDKDNNPINGASVKITDNQSNEWNLTTDANGKITQQKLHKAHYAYVPGSAGGDNVYVKTDYNPFTIRISHQNYPSREFEFTMDKKIDWTIALKDRPMSVGSIKVWGTEYADDEPGTIYAQVTYGDGTPCNTIASTDITATVYKSDGSKIIDGANMTYVDGSNGIYKYNFSGSTFSAEGVYIIDVKVDSTSPSITAYDSNEIHISKTANRIKTMVADVWGYTGRSLDNISNIVSGVWNAATSSMTTVGSIGKLLVDNIDDKISNIAGNVWSYTGSALDTAGNAISKVWSYESRTLSGFGTLVADVWKNTDNIGSTLATNLGKAIWEYSTRTLSNFGTLAADVWSNASRTLSSALLGSGGELATKTTVETATSSAVTSIKGTSGKDLTDISGEIAGVQTTVTSIESKVDSLHTKVDTVDANVDTIISKWGSYSASDIIGYVDEIESRLGDNADTCVLDDTVFGNIQCIRDKWGDTQTADMIYTAANNAYDTTVLVRAELAYSGKSTTAYDDIQSLKGYVDTLESSIGTSSDTSSNNTVFGKIKGVQDSVDQLTTIDTNIDTLVSKWGSYSASDIYDKVKNLSSDISAINTVSNVSSILSLAQTDADNMTDLKNKVLGMKAVVDVNRMLLDGLAHQPVIKTWLEEGSVIFKTLITNPSQLYTQTVPLKYYLPREANKEDIIKMDEDLSVEYDASREAYYVNGEFKLKPGETKTFSVEVANVWQIPEEEIASLKNQADELFEPLKKTSYFAQGSTLKNDIYASLDKAESLMKNAYTPEARIRAYREALIEIESAKRKLEDMKTLVSSAGSIGTMFGFMGGVSTVGTFGIIIVVIVGIAFLGLLFRQLFTGKTIKVTAEDGKKTGIGEN